MAYNIKQLTLSSYQQTYAERFESIQPSTYNYAPNITDASSYWVINVYDIANPEGAPVLILENVINAGYSTIVYYEDLTPDTEAYKYRLRVADASNQLIYDQVIDAATYSTTDLIFKFVMYSVGSPPIAPSGLIALALTNSSIRLIWIDNSIDETKFHIELSPDNNTWVEIATVNSNIVTYTNTGLSPITTYYYRVRAKNTYGYSSYSNVANATTPFGSFVFGG